MSDVSITMLDVPSTFCHETWQQTFATFASLLRGTVEVGNGILFQNTTPAPEDRDKAWYRINADGTPDKLYSYSSGNWLALHLLPPGLIMLYDGAEATIDTLDGGEAGTITASTGPFWQKVAGFNAKFPIGVGTLPSGTVINVGGTGGDETVELDLENIPSHDHGLPNKKVLHQTLTSGVLTQNSGNDVSVTTFQAEGGKSNGSTKPHNNIPPYKATLFLVRTARLYYRI